jgi:hypothetical protein
MRKWKRERKCSYICLKNFKAYGAPSKAKYFKLTEVS